MNKQETLSKLKKRTVTKVHHEELNQDFYVRHWTVKEMQSNLELAKNEKNDPTELARIVSKALCDENGNLLFGEEDVEELAASLEMPLCNWLLFEIGHVNGSAKLEDVKKK